MSNQILPRRRLMLFEKNPTCCYCGKTVRWKGRPRGDRATLDHLKPRCKGGTNGWHNLRMACNLCNNCKDDRTPQEWARDILAPITFGWRRWLVAIVLRLV